MKKSDHLLSLAIFLLISFGLLILGSLSKNDVSPFFALKKQLIFIAIGVILFLAMSTFDWRILHNSSALLLTLYGLSLISLFLVLFFGKTSRGATGWFNFGFFSLQPVEFTKIILILVLAKYLSSRHLEIWQFKYLFISGIYALLPIGLVLLQPDLGGAVILGLIWFCLVLVSGIRWGQIFGLLIVFILTIALAWGFLLKPYQQARILNFLNPQQDLEGIGYNRNQALISIGSGRIFGKGLGWGTQTQLNFLPLAKTDFIFAALAEELGLIGVIILLSLYLLLFYRLSYWANVFDTNFCKLFTFGFTTKLLIEVFINLGMNTGILPIIGIALPFLSYGGSHLLVDFIGLGIVNSMIRHRT
ncbi:MAG: rod shape-determining protein RodA [Parcubacteria group bacterium]|nr:rod shape-determining protein RodA [Parcubacteria group bacterium]